MAIRSKEFVGIAEGIKGHELSTKGRIENLKGTILELSNQKNALNNQISYLEAALAAAYEDTDEDGNPDYGCIAAIEAQINLAETQLSGVEQQLDGAHGELSQSQAELETVMEEKARTLFEIQERARKTSRNISVAGGMYGAYSGVGGSLQSSFQTSLSSLSQAASILDGSVDGGVRCNGAAGAGNTVSKGAPAIQGDLSTGALSAFTGGANGACLSSGEGGGMSSPGDFTTHHTDAMTPATTPNFHLGQKTINAQKPLSFKSDQDSNTYATASFSETDEVNCAEETFFLRSSQTSSKMESRFSKSSSSPESNGGTAPKGDLENRRIWTKQYQVGFTLVTSGAPGSGKSSNSSHSDKGERELADELEHGFILSVLGSKFGSSSKATSHTATPAHSTADRRKEFVQRMKVDVSPIVPNSGSSSSTSGESAIDQRVRERVRGDNSDYERGLLTAFGLGYLSQRESKSAVGTGYEPAMSPRNQILAGKGVDSPSKGQLQAQPRSLSRTSQGWTKGAEGTLTYNSPIETGSKLDFHQGKVENFGGTCGLCSCENVLRMAGVPISEADIVKYASTTYEDTNGSFVASLTKQTLCRTNSSPSSNGGTSAKARQKILEHFGIPSYTAKQSIETIADAVSTGHGVIASVHAERLYFKRRPIHPDLHAITITSVLKDNTGKNLGFYVCDSNAFALGGTGATYYTAEEFEEALSERECNITSTIIR